VLPGTLRIRVTERQPVAQAVTLQPLRGGGFSTVLHDFDETGVVMRPLDPAWRLTPAPANALLPTLTGVPPGDLNPGHQAESPRFLPPCACSRNWIAPHGRPGGVGEHQCGVAGNPGGDDEPGGAHHFFARPIRCPVAPLRAIYNHGQEQGKAIAALDLSISNHLPVRWVAGSALPPLPGRLVKPNQLKRKNV